MYGMLVDTVHNITCLMVGDAQVHAREYRADQSFYRAIPNSAKILDAARSEGIDAAPRSYGFGLVSVKAKSAGARFWGVDVAAEKKALDLVEQVGVGRFLSVERIAGPDGPVREIVLGRKLAKTLQAQMGTEIVAVVQAADGSMGNELFYVRGILKSVGEELDRMAAVIQQEDFEELFVAGGRVHEIAFNAHGKLSPEEIVATLSPVTGELELLSWDELIPAFADMVSMLDASVWIMALIFFLGAGLGVMNTMLMATYERIREFGMLKAMGATPWRIVRDVASEAFMLALFSTAIGVVIGTLATVYLHVYGLDLSGLGGDIMFSGVAFNPIWKAALEISGIVFPVVVMWLVCVVAALYPAVKAARLDPVQAIHHV
jgi:ABC-type lipoprotein release transport system permease subunit